jgi:hypothetical protein
MINGIINRKSVDIGVAAVLAAVMLWASFQIVPKLGFLLILPAFALALRLFPSGIHAGKELDVFTYGVTTAILAVIIYGAMRIIFRHRT